MNETMTVGEYIGLKEKPADETIEKAKRMLVESLTDSILAGNFILKESEDNNAQYAYTIGLKLDVYTNPVCDMNITQKCVPQVGDELYSASDPDGQPYIVADFDRSDARGCRDRIYARYGNAMASIPLSSIGSRFFFKQGDARRAVLPHMVSGIPKGPLCIL